MAKLCLQHNRLSIFTISSLAVPFSAIKVPLQASAYAKTLKCFPVVYSSTLMVSNIQVLREVLWN